MCVCVGRGGGGDSRGKIQTLVCVHHRYLDLVDMIFYLSTLEGFDDVLGTSSLKMTPEFDDVLDMSSAKISENNLLEFQILRHCQNDVITLLSVADARYRQQLGGCKS